MTDRRLLQAILRTPAPVPPEGRLSPASYLARSVPVAGERRGLKSRRGVHQARGGVGGVRGLLVNYLKNMTNLSR